MPSFHPSLDPAVAAAHLDTLLAPDLCRADFSAEILQLQRLFSAYAASCPPPWPVPGLIVTAELQYQSELWLPLQQIASAFRRFYVRALNFEPIFFSTPFATVSSWAALVAAMPPVLDQGGNPARILERVLTDPALRLQFLCWSFMPQRFYGAGFERYPAQTHFLQEWLLRCPPTSTIRCLDAACGDGAGTYLLARILLESGRRPDQFAVEGWTLDPLEVWAAAHMTIPHAPAQETYLRQLAAPVMEQGAGQSLLFRQVDLLSPPEDADMFDVIICNGFLGGPILHRHDRMKTVVGNLAGMLNRGGILLAADRFHGGWKKDIPKGFLEDVFTCCGLQSGSAGEGICGIKNG